MLHHGGKRASAQHVPGAQVLGLTQAAVRRVQAGEHFPPGVNGLAQLLFPALPGGDLLLQGGDPLPCGSACGAQQGTLLLQGRLPLGGAVRYPVQLPAHFGQPFLGVLHVPEGLLILGLGRQGLRLLFGEADLPVAGDAQPQPLQAHALQLLHVPPLLGQDLLQLLRPGGTLVRLFPQDGPLGQQPPPLLLPFPQLRQGTVQFFQCTRHIPSLLSPVFSLLFYPPTCLRASFPLDFPAEMP